MDKWINKIHNGKSELLIPLLPDECIDIVITSPPYNVDLGNNKHNKHKYDIYKDNIKYVDYIAWLSNIFTLLYPKMVSGGRVCINIGDKKNGNIPTHSDIIQFMTKDIGYLIKSTIIWNKNQIGNRTAWGSFKSPSNPSFPTPFEYILIFCKDSQRKDGLIENSTITKSEFIRNSLALWSFAPENKMNELYNHPGMFPIELPYRLIQQLSYKDDIVFDMFSGMGTTCLAAAMLYRRWLGFELSPNYTDDSTKRIQKYTDQERLF